MFKFSNPSLYKFCAEEFDVSNGCNTIRVGTLWGFREEENELLKDEGEGKFSYTVKFPKLTPVSREWLEAFELGGGASGSLTHLEMKDGQARIKGLTLDGSAENGWIYCVSSKKNSVGNISEAHQVKWEIPSENVPKFVNYLANLLWASVTVDDIPAHILSGVSISEVLNGLGLDAEIQQVEYLPREVIIENADQFGVDELVALKKKIPFIKPERFQDEAEVRFAFWLTYMGKRISIKDKAKILQLRPIDGLLK